jgi:hypothetical protein
MTKRKGRRLLVAGLGIAAVSFVACDRDNRPPPEMPPTPPTQYPVGNLRPPDPPPPQTPEGGDAAAQGGDAHPPGWNLPDGGAKDGWL